MKRPSESLDVEVVVVSAQKGRRRPHVGPSGAEEPEPARVPRVTRLMALAIKFEDMVQRGEVRDFAEIAHWGHVTRARLTQIMNLLLLAPDIQESLLRPDGTNLPTERDLRRICAVPVWPEQRIMLAEGLNTFNRSETLLS